jgi:DNA-directed RNA polymerase sigma subunit (sigma70/sigma32)
MTSRRKVWWFDDGSPKGGWSDISEEADGFDIVAETRTLHLREALESLTPKQRFVIECSWGLRGEEMSLREISEQMDISFAATLRIYDRAMSRLRKGVVSYTGEETKRIS